MGYLSIFFILLIIFLYLYRRIANLQCYNSILEKKISNLKKENANLKENLYADKNAVDNNEKSEIEFMKIFNENECDIINSIYISESLDYLKQNIINDNHDNDNTVDVSHDAGDKCVITELENLESEDVDNIINNDLPIANHIVSSENADVESILSDDNAKYSKKSLSKMNLDKIRDICNSMNISTEGTKNVLIDKILQQ
jgi:hypothetical protein